MIILYYILFWLTLSQLLFFIVNVILMQAFDRVTSTNITVLHDGFRTKRGDDKLLVLVMLYGIILIPLLTVVIIDIRQTNYYYSQLSHVLDSNINNFRSFHNRYSSMRLSEDLRNDLFFNNSIKTIELKYTSKKTNNIIIKFFKYFTTIK